MVFFMISGVYHVEKHPFSASMASQPVDKNEELADVAHFGTIW